MKKCPIISVKTNPEHLRSYPENGNSNHEIKETKGESLFILNPAVERPKKSKNGEREELMKRAEITRGVIGRNCTTPSDSFVFFRFLRLNCRFEIHLLSKPGFDRRR